MKIKPAKTSRRKPSARRAPRTGALGPKAKNFQDGSALILDVHGGTIGLIEARTPYQVRKRARGLKATSR